MNHVTAKYNHDVKMWDARLISGPWQGVTVRHRKRKDAIASAVGVATVMNKRNGIDCDLPYYDDRGACWSGANCQKARRYSGSFEVGA